ncbi:hypothetical protein [Thiolapillus sp.]|nr:hypothetical protein [Thiolapillus sp.]
MTKVELSNEYKSVNYIYLILLLFSIFQTASIFYDIVQIHIYRHDALYYMPNANTYYKYRVASEGRWIVYGLFYFITKIPGNILSIFALLSFGYFVFISIYKWVENYYYALILSLLFMQIPSFYDLITWPATAAPAFLVLLVAISLQKKLNIFVFFIIFGILFFGTMSNYYYLLPLLYLNYFQKHNWKESLKFTSYKLISAWAIGFIVGYIVTQLILYVNFDHFLAIEAWRDPHYIHSMEDMYENILRSLRYLQRDIQSIFLNSWIILLFIFTLIVSTIDRRKDLIFIPLVLFSLIILIHYVIVLPVGIYIAPRTIVATWVGILAILFFIPSIKQWQIYLLVPIIVFYTSILYLNNHNNMRWYANVTNIHFDKLISETPKDPKDYKGVILYASDSDIQKRNNLISSINHTVKDSNITGQGVPRAFMRWAPLAWEAGYKSVGNCNDKQSRNAAWHTIKDLNKICKEVSKFAENKKTLPIKNITFYNILGEYDGRLIIEFNDGWNQK